MQQRHHTHGLKNRIALSIFKIRNWNKESFECPVCSYRGPFMDIFRESGTRKHAKCPGCNALERHRIQFVVIDAILRTMATDKLAMLHFAPERFFRNYFAENFGRYETADIAMQDVDHHVDLQQLPFGNESYDFIFASHVLEHIPDDGKAISEIRRILKPNGMAVLPVPIVAEKTIEYPEANPHEAYHVRAPGPDYFTRYERHFSRVKKFSSDTLPEKYQLFVFEDRSRWPTKEMPLRPAMQGDRHIDIVPVCYA